MRSSVEDTRSRSLPWRSASRSCPPAHAWPSALSSPSARAWGSGLAQSPAWPARKGPDPHCLTTSRRTQEVLRRRHHRHDSQTDRPSKTRTDLLSASIRRQPPTLTRSCRPLQLRLAHRARRGGGLGRELPLVLQLLDSHAGPDAVQQHQNQLTALGLADRGIKTRQRSTATTRTDQATTTRSSVRRAKAPGIVEHAFVTSSSDARSCTTAFIRFPSVSLSAFGV